MEFHHALLRHNAGDFQGALTGYRRALVIAPDNAQVWNNLGILFASRKNWPVAHLCFNRAACFEPERYNALENLARSLMDRDKGDAAAALGQRMIIDRPDLAQGYLFFHLLFTKINRLDISRQLLERAVRLAPENSGSHVFLARVLLKQGLLAAAMDSAQTALEAAAEPSEPHGIMGEALAQHGRVAEALTHFQRAVGLNPQRQDLEASWLYHSNYLDGGDNDLLTQHRLWASLHGDCKGRTPLPYLGTADPERPLRIGIVSGDFCFHAVAYFLVTLLQGMDRARAEIICYSNTPRPDENTETMRGYADVWHDIRGLDDDQAAALIRQDRVDVLVDVAGHTTSGRLLIFARRPAPVQVTWLGYPNTIGLPAIGYRLTDAVADPPGMTEAYHTETLVRLPRSFLCYRPTGFMSEPSPTAPCVDKGHITFGSFNNISKVTPAVVALWARILIAVPESRLLLKSRSFNDEGTQQFFRDQVRACGVDPDRLILLTHLPPEEHFAVYNSIDIALDPFPYNGTTTTCEALWMGVPVITLTGTTHRARVGTSLLHSVGLDDLAAPDADSYVETAVSLASDTERLTALRNGLRARMGASPLRDEAGFAAEFEAAVRQLWRQWCATAESVVAS